MASPDLSFTQLLPSGDVVGALTPTQLGELVAELSSGASELAALPRARRAELIATTCRELLGADELLERMITEGAAATGYHPRTLAASLRHLLELMTPAALQTLLEDELGPELPELAFVADARRATTRALVGPRCCVQIHAATVPSAPVEGLLLSLLAGVPALVRTSDHERATTRFILKALRRHAPELARHAAVVSWPSEDTKMLAALAPHAPLILCHGSDRAVEQVRRAVAEQAEVIGYGHRVSCLIVAPEGPMSAPQIADLARAIARDTALFEGQGCMSPQTVFVLPPADQEELADRLAEELVERAWPALSEELPRGTMPTGVAAEQMQLAGVAEFLGRALRSEGGVALVHRDRQLHPSPGWRLLHFVSCEDAQEVEEALRDLRLHLSTAGLHASPREHAAWCRRLASVGFRRVCRPGRMQRPVLLRAHDGLPRLRSWFRICDVEG